jgi:Tol biopolymer transport system component
MGTIPYMAPEQLEDSRVGPAADMWALGATLYTAVEGRQPFTGSTIAAVMTAILTKPVTLPEYAGPLRDLISALLAKDPADRPDAEAAMTALADLAAANGAGTGGSRTASAWHDTYEPSAEPSAADPDVTAGARPPGTNLAAGYALPDTILPVQDVGWMPPQPGSSPDNRPARTSRRKIPVALAAGAAAVAMLVVLVLVTASHPPARRTQGSPPASGPVLSATATVTLTDPDGLQGIAFSPNGKALAASAENHGENAGHVDIWNPGSGRSATVLTDTAAGGNLVNGMAFSQKDANSLAVGDLLGVDIWNLAARSASTYDVPDGWAVTDVAYAPNGTTVAECNENGHVYLLDTVTGQWLAQHFTDPAATQSNDLIQVAFSPDGRTLAASDAAGIVYVWRLSGGAPLVIRGSSSDGYETQTIAFSPDGGTLAVALQGGVQLWDVATRKLTARLTGDDASPDAIAFSPRGTVLAVGGDGGGLYLWDLATRQETVRDSSLTGWDELTFSPDGKALAALDGPDDEIQLYNLGYPAS